MSFLLTPVSLFVAPRRVQNRQPGREPRQWTGRGGRSSLDTEGKRMINFEKKTALVTGASSGIGRAFAQTLAARGADVILVARSTDRLNALAAALRRDHRVTADVIAADLSRPEAPDSVHAAVEALGRRVDVLINNAGFGAHGPFHAQQEQMINDLLMLNVVALVRLSRLFLPGMLAKKEGIIVHVASNAAFQPVPYMAIYGASKAFVLSFSEALWGEYRTQGIRVLALCPGATETEFFRTAGEDAAMGRKRPVDSVVATALKALDRGKPSVVDGGLNRLAAQSIRLAPRRLVAQSAARIMRPRERK